MDFVTGFPEYMQMTVFRPFKDVENSVLVCIQWMIIDCPLLLSSQVVGRNSFIIYYYFVSATGDLSIITLISALLSIIVYEPLTPLLPSIEYKGCLTTLKIYILELAFLLLDRRPSRAK